MDTEDVGLDDTFFDIGGHSLLVMKAITKVYDKTGIKLSPQDFLIATLEQMAQKIEKSYFFKDEVSPTAETIKDLSLEEFQKAVAEKAAAEKAATGAVSIEAAAEVAATEEVTVDKAAVKREVKSKGFFATLRGFWS